ncbi:MAG TPA: hypothetical protein VJY39_05580 [Acidisphaera sp.]|nr:hypothetical protein [Acidisphaera sp.]
MIKRALPALVLLVAGCVDYVPTRQSELTQFVGKSETQLVAAIGVPTRTYEAAGSKFLAYDQARAVVDPGSPGWGWGWGWGWGAPWGWGPAFPPAVFAYSCETTFQVHDGLVQSFSFTGSGCSSIAPLGTGRVGPLPAHTG